MKTGVNNSIFVIAIIAVMIFLIAAQPGSPALQDPAPILRARQIELVDDQGKVRASLKIEDGGETVFRIMDAEGAIRVKLGGSKDGSGLVMLNDETEPGIHALAKKQGTTLTLSNKDGKKKEIMP